MKKLRARLLPFIDVLILPFLYPIAWALKNIRRVGVHKLPYCRNALKRIGVFPIRDHYYEPQFDYQNKKQPFSRDRNLPGIDWNVAGQLEMLASFSFTQELAQLPVEKEGALDFHFGNLLFGSGDAEYWYQLIRSVQPRRIIEVGGGYSTLMAIKAVRKNREDNPSYSCRHICIEPYEQLWLENTGVPITRRKVEDLPLKFFSELQQNDLLFIDSSHIIRPQGDVTFEFLEVLPVLNKGVIVHIHDIYSPKNYLGRFLEESVLFWNEQYLLEAFLTHNDCWKILAALNFLHHHHYEKLKSVAPYLTPEREPCSFYIQRMA
jgi:predicted O-methyltransferase YrrM